MTELPPCPVDDTPVHDGAVLCRKCTARLTNVLRAIPDLMDELALLFTKRAKVVSYNTGAPTELDPGKPMVYNVAASKAKSDLKAVLVSWAKLVHDKHPAAPLTCADTSTSISGWLLVFMPWLRRYEHAADLHDELTQCVRTIRRLIDAQPAKNYLGKCGFEWQGNTCTAELWGLPTQAEVECKACGTVWNAEGRRAGALAAAMEQVAGPEVIARALGSHGVTINAERIYNWRKRGKLEPAAFDARTGRAQYRLGDVMDVWHATQLSPQNTARTKETTPDES
jgi:hypothetical protein